LNFEFDINRVARVAGILFIAFGLFARIAPLADADGRLFRQWPTEDGYLTLTIARNMALGKGMSTADGELETNGTQPLATAIWAAAFAVVDGDRHSGVALVLALELLISLCAAFMLYRVAAQIYARVGLDTAWALFATGAWYASTLVITHSMNALESGLYGLAVLITVDYYLRAGTVDSNGGIRFSWAATLVMGVLLSLCFYARNDAVMLIGAFCISCLVGVTPRLKVLFGNLPKVFVAGALTVLLALPWLINNVVKFGYLMPISGVAESFHATFGGNAYVVPTIWMEYVSVLVPVPQSLEENSIVFGTLAVALLALCLLGVRGFARLPVGLRHTALLIALYAIFLTAYYGLFQRASWFMARYLFPVSPFVAIVTIGLAARLAARARNALQPRVAAFAAAAMAAAFVFNAALNYRIYQAGSHHMHQQVVEWVQQHVGDDVWIGAVQTGTLGFFHDRTLNLDGKVNPEALAANLAGRVPEYVNTKELQVLADWYGMTRWAELPALKDKFEVLVADQQRNLGVVARKDWKQRRTLAATDTM
jgi:hypothetical protein